MNKETVLSMVETILSNTVDLWVKEVNTEGDDFNFDSQDIFRSLYEECVTKWKLIEEYPAVEYNDERKEIISSIMKYATKIIELYNRHKILFRMYDREKLMLKTYRQRNPQYNRISDTELKIYIGIELEVPSRDVYYKSPFYKQYGFLLNDYHFEICVFCKYLLNEIKNEFNDTEPYKTFIENSDLTPYFSMGLIYNIYTCCNEEQFEKMSELDFYRDLNLMSLYSKLKISKSETKRAYYIIHKLSYCIKSREVRSYWVSVILNRLGKP